MVATAVLIGVVFLIGGVAALLSLKPTWENRDEPGSRSFGVFAAAVAGYVIASGLDLFTQSYAVSLGLQKVVNACGVVIGVCWLSLSVEVSDRVHLSRPKVVAGVVFVLVAWAVNFLNPNELVMARGAGLDRTQFEVVGGPAFWGLLVTAWGQILVGTGLLVAEYADATGLKRRQIGVLTLAIVPAFLASVLNGTVLSISDIAHDYTVIGWLLSLAVFGAALYSGQFLDASIVARRRVFEDSSDPVVTLDTVGRVVDSNPAARALADVNDDWEKTPVDKFFASLPIDTRCLWGDESVDTEITLDSQGRRRHFTLETKQITSPQENTIGYLVLLFEITSIKEQERKIDLMRQVQSRVLRHNIRHDVQIMWPALKLAVEAVEGDERRLVEQAIDRSRSLLSVSRKARDIERLAECDETTTLNLEEILSSLVAEQRERFPQVTFTVNTTGDCRVETISAVRLAFENLIENAAEHNDADDPQVMVTVDGNDARVTTTVRDNGPGVPDHEVAVVREGIETQLEHGTGIGLWVVQWVIDSSRARINYETSDDGTAVTVTVPRSAETTSVSSR